MCFINKIVKKISDNKLIKKIFKKEKRNDTDNTLYNDDNWNHIKDNVNIQIIELFI
jgi:hypothetical protein